MNWTNLYCTALIIQWSDEYSEYEEPILYYLFSDQRNPVNLRNLYWTALFIQLRKESSEFEEPILYGFIYSVIWGILWIRGIYTELLHLFSYLRNPVNLRNQYCSAIFTQWSEESSESEEPILNCFIYSVIWGLQWIWGTYTELLYLFSDLRNPVNLRNLYCTASFIQWFEESSESEEPILHCFIYSVIWEIQLIWGINTVLLHLSSDLRNPVNLRNLYFTARIQWIWSTDTVLLHLFSDLRNPLNLRYRYCMLHLFTDLRNLVNLRNLYSTALFIQWSEESSDSEEPILYCFSYSVTEESSED